METVTIDITTQDIRALNDVNQQLKLELTPGPTFLETDRLTPTTLLVITIDDHLGYQPIRTLEDAVRRGAKRLSKARRIWTRRALAERLQETVGSLPAIQEMPAKQVASRITKRLNEMVKDNDLQVLCLD